MDIEWFALGALFMKPGTIDRVEELLRPALEKKLPPSRNMERHRG